MRIVTDCAADMSTAELEALDVTQAPLFIQFPEGELSAAEITPDAFYDRLEAMRPAVPTTAQPAPGEPGPLLGGVERHVARCGPGDLRDAGGQRRTLGIVAPGGHGQ